jgi:hypothetical protein
MHYVVDQLKQQGYINITMPSSGAIIPGYLQYFELMHKQNMQCVHVLHLQSDICYVLLQFSIGPLFAVTF